MSKYSIQAKRLFNFNLSSIKFENKSMMSPKYYFRYNSFIRKNIADIFCNDYDIPNKVDKDWSAIMSMIDYVERNEPRRSFFNVFYRRLFVYNLNN